MSALSGSELGSRLAELLNVPPISIELLPGDGSEWLAVASPAHAPFLSLDRNLGVPQKAAYRAYLEAVSRFRGVRQRLLHPRSLRGQPVSDRNIAEAAASSSVLLLVNPAHQCALNARKRLVELGSLDAAHELAFMGALLTLREGAKQSILWQHRRWLLRRIHPPIRPPQAPSLCKGDGVDSLYGVALDAGTFRAELAAVTSRAGMRGLPPQLPRLGAPVPLRTSSHISPGLVHATCCITIESTTACTSFPSVAQLRLGSKERTSTVQSSVGQMDRQTAFMLAHGVLRIDLGSQISRTSPRVQWGRTQLCRTHVSWADDHAWATRFKST
ncbi:hypothetical protein L227DRAFT_658671 [Lentinus tigrinus ALCF2SS1-6]|uniref:Uncharacterized protein n=1 Tax=Lentinus tigrinus ALCF2SS1-6 TaxID=1328759 RepID=A0A5C2RNQ7_9APHY|nr:hypothetical protein L227DRAFT_658671 [Lentinus tigrinus ALCF2SS1-6]